MLGSLCPCTRRKLDVPSANLTPTQPGRESQKYSLPCISASASPARILFSESERKAAGHNLPKRAGTDLSCAHAVRWGTQVNAGGGNAMLAQLHAARVARRALRAEATAPAGGGASGVEEPGLGLGSAAAASAGTSAASGSARAGASGAGSIGGGQRAALSLLTWNLWCANVRRHRFHISQVSRLVAAAISARRRCSS